MHGNPGGDCSDRMCPFERGWADSPNSAGDTHSYLECAGKGICDRTSGQCKCYEGFEGKGCGRQRCPADCSGFGKCEYVRDLTYGFVYNTYYDGTTAAKSGFGTGAVTLPNHHWDADRARACVCDPDRSGIDCSLRMCPYGNDIMDVMPNFDEFSSLGMAGHGNELAHVQKIQFFDSALTVSNFVSGTDSFALRFTSKLNETYVTQPIVWDSVDADFAVDIETALEGLPNQVVNDVVVTVASADGASGVEVFVTFVGTSVQGAQHRLEVVAGACGEGCTPRTTGLSNLATFVGGTGGPASTLSSVTVEVAGNFNSYECGRRGKCNYETGLCACFEGYTGDTCTTITALV